MRLIPLLLAFMAGCAGGRDGCEERVERLEKRVASLEKRVDEQQVAMIRAGLLLPDGTALPDPLEPRCGHVDDGVFSLTPSGTFEVLDAPEAVLDQVSVLPSYDENLVFRGYRVTSLDPGSILRECGLRRSDVVFEVNDIVLANPDGIEAQASRLVEAIENEGVLRVRVLRRGEVTSLTLEGIEDLLDVLAF